MPDITASFANGYDASRRWVIVDSGRDPNAPPTIYDGYLDAGATTDPLPIYSSDGIYGEVIYQRSDGAQTIASSITDNSVVTME